MSQEQIHKRLSEEQVIAILENYLAKEVSSGEAMNILGLAKSQFFRLVSQYRQDAESFSLQHRGNQGNRRIPPETEQAILKELRSEEKLIKNKDISIKNYNYSAIQESLQDKHRISVSLPTIISRAKENDFYLKRPAGKSHDREVLTALIGELVQHDSSHHLWSPYMEKKLYLITTIDDHSRLLLYADLVEAETAWAHIEAARSVFLGYGLPLKYYPDQHSIFRYVKDRDKHSPWNRYTKFTDDIDPQWKQVLKECGVTVTYALSPQAKGKVERPYGWLQDRIYRTAAKEGIHTIEGLRKVLKELVYKYNHKWVHSTTKEIPIIRFEEAQRENRSLFTPLRLTEQDKTLEDIFCLRSERVVDSYRKISFNGAEVRVPNGTPRKRVELKMTPDPENDLIRIRFWEKNTFLGEKMERTEKLPILRF